MVEKEGKDSIFYDVNNSASETSQYNSNNQYDSSNSDKVDEASNFEVNLTRENETASSQIKEDVGNVTDSNISREDALKENHKDDHTKIFAKLVYWVALFAAIIGNFIATVVLVPFIIMLESKLILYLIIMVLGVVFGALFSFLLLDLSKLDKNNHVVSGAVIPALALINVYIMVEISKVVGTMLDMDINRNSITISIIYVCMFVLPYALGTAYKSYLKSK